jgi:hypothetical protein
MTGCDWAVLSKWIDRNQSKTCNSYICNDDDDWGMAINPSRSKNYEHDMALAFVMASHDRLGDNATSKDIFIESGIIEMILGMFLDICHEERRESSLQFRLEYMESNRLDVSHRVRHVHWSPMTSDTTDLLNTQPSLCLARPHIFTSSIDVAFSAFNQQYFVTRSPLHQVRIFVKDPWCLYGLSVFHSFLKKRKKKINAV